jgi:hypothetical protein
MIKKILKDVLGENLTKENFFQKYISKIVKATIMTKTNILLIFPCNNVLGVISVLGIL